MTAITSMTSIASMTASKPAFAALIALGLLSGAAYAGTVFDGLRDTAPRSVFSDIQASAPRSVFDELRSSAPRAPFDQIRDTAPRSDGVFGGLQTGAP